MRPLTIGLIAILACGDGGRDPGRGAEDADPREPSIGVDVADRPEERMDTLLIEGMAEPILLRLFVTDDDFPLPFSAYVPADMATDAERTDSTGAVHIRAEFGGVRNPDAYLHLFVHPPGTGRQEALAAAQGYVAGRGVPVSHGIDDPGAMSGAARMPWAVRAWTFRYETGGETFVGSVGVGERRGRFYQLVRHYPAEYGDGFGPRAALVESTWRWSDGTALRDGAASPAPGEGPPEDG